MKQLIQRLRDLRWSTAVGSVLLIAFIAAAGAVLWRDGRELSQQISEVRYGLLAFSFLIEVTGWLFAVFVWQGVVSRFDDHLPWREHFRIYAYSMLGIAVPGRIWTVAGRAVLYEQQGASKLSVTAASVVEYLLLGISSLMVFGLTGVFSGVGQVWERPIIGIGCAIIALVLIQPPLFNRLTAWAMRRVRQERAPTQPMGYRDLLLWLAIECLVVVIGGTAVYVLFHSILPATPGLFLAILMAWAAAAVAGNLFFWIPGPVIRDGFMIAVLSQTLPNSVALLFTLIVRVWTIGSILALVGLTWVIVRIDNLVNRSPIPIADATPPRNHE
jgi:hypothetical protein